MAGQMEGLPLKGKRAPMTASSERSPVVYDKGKYHDETIESYGLPGRQACVHTAFFLGWIIDNDLFSDFFRQESGDEIRSYKDRKIDAVEVYEHWDRCLIDDMLSEEGNRFAQAYFDFDNGEYLNDYIAKMQGSLPSEFHVEYTWENQAAMDEIIGARYRDWKADARKKVEGRSEAIQADNRQEVKQIRSSVWLFMAVLLINGIIMWLFNLSGIVMMSALVAIAAGIPLLFWVGLKQKTIVVELGPLGCRYMEELGRELVVRNEIRKEELEKVIVVKEGKGIYWCRVVPKSGRGILIGNFQDKHLAFISRMVEQWQDRVQYCEITPEEKKEKRSHDCLP